MAKTLLTLRVSRVKKSWDWKANRMKSWFPTSTRRKSMVYITKICNNTYLMALKWQKVHRVIMFQQSEWLAEYIILNTEKRKTAKNPFKKYSFKLMNNAIFGKTMINVRKRINAEMVQTERSFKKVAAKPTFHRFKICNEGLVGILLFKQISYSTNPYRLGLLL